MTTSSSSAKCRGLIAAILFLLTSLANPALAQTASGTITGRVYHEATGESLRGAVVRVEGTSAQDFTTEDGRFQLVAPAGTATVRVEYVGLDAATLQVQVPAGGNVVVAAGLSSRVLELEPVIVRATALGQSLAINQQKTASGIVNIFSEEIFGQMSDGNIGNALQRLPGISVNEDQDGSASGINIRGIEADYNSFQVDGNRVPTSGGGRGFDPRQFAADGVTRIELIKAPTPDRDGDAIGGIVNVVSRSAFQRDGREMRAKLGGVYSDLPGKWGHAADLSYSNLFSVGDGQDNLGISGTVSSYRTDRYSRNRDMDWVQVTPENNPELGLDQYDEPVWFMESSHWEYDTRVTRTTTVSGSIDFRTNEFNSFYLRPMYSHARREGNKYETDIDIDTRFQNAAGGRKTYDVLTPSMGRGTPGDDGSRGSRGWIGTFDDRHNNLYSLNLGARHERPDSLLTYDLFYSRSRQTISGDVELNMLMEPDDPWLLFEYELINPSRGLVDIRPLDGQDHTDLSLMTEGELVEESSIKTEDVYSARLDWERAFARDWGALTFKTGGKFRRSAPRFDQLVDVYSMDDAFPYTSVVDATTQSLLGGAKYYDVHARRAQDLLGSNPELFEFEEEDSLEDSNFEDYDATEDTTAGYLMGTLRRGAHTLLAGVRYERVDWKNTNKIVSYLDGDPTVTSVRTDDSYGFWLPGVHLRHELRPNLILRESYNRSYGRPRLAELTSGRFVNEDGDISDGNPQLQPAVSDNFDLQLEYYPGNGGLYSVGVFYKDVKDFSYTRVYNFSTLDTNGIPIPDEEGDFEYERPENGSTAKNYGVELIARQRLAFLPGVWRGLSAAFSATFSDSEATYPDRTDGRKLPVPGFSKFMFTGTLEWVWNGLNVRADYRFRDDYVEGLGDSIESDEFYAAEKRVDLELGYRFANGVRLFASGTNLTDEAQVSYSGYRQFVEDASLAGRKYTLGLDFRF